MSDVFKAKAGLVGWLDQRCYSGFDDNWDDQLFADAIRPRIGPESVILDLGAGAGIVEALNFRGVAAKACGVDPDERVLENPYLDEGRVGFGEDIPYPDDTFDVVFSDNVLEHLENPQAVFDEVARVLKPGGRFLFKTPNRRHYVPLVARVTPHWFHQFYNGLRGREPEDTFPTQYRANTLEDVRRYANAAGLRVRSLRLIEGRPEYLRINPLTYAVGAAYERLVNSVSSLEQFRVLLVGELELD